VDRPVPYPVEKRVPYPVQVPVEVKVPVPVSAPAQRFATVHYYQQSPVALGYESSALYGQSGYKAFSSGLAQGSGSTLYSSVPSSGSAFYSSTPASAGAFYSSTSSPISTYSSTVSPAGFYGSNVAQEGFVGSSAAPFNFGQQYFIGSSTPAPLNTFSADSASPDASSLFQSRNIGSDVDEEVAIGSASLKSQELKANNFDVVKK